MVKLILVHNIVLGYLKLPQFRDTISHCLFALVLKSPDGEWPITYTLYIIHYTLNSPSEVTEQKLE